MSETIKDRIDKDKNNFIDINEIKDFIFDEKEWEKNLNDLWNHLNNIFLSNIIWIEEIKTVIINYFKSKEYEKIQFEIWEKVSNNSPLDKKELSLCYLEMISQQYKTHLPEKQLKFDSNCPIDKICNWELVTFLKTKYLNFTYTWDNKEILQKWWNKISEDMFQQLLIMEGSQWYVSRIHSKFWERFPTWPYGMVYKHIDKNWNLLDEKNITHFRNWEKVSKERALDNARAYYNRRAQEWKELLDEKWYEYNQAQLDSLVSASWWTQRSVDRLQNFVLSHRDNPRKISNFMSTFATTAANWKPMAGLVIRRQFESNWFNWIEKPFSEYQKEYYEKHPPKSRRRK